MAKKNKKMQVQLTKQQVIESFRNEQAKMDALKQAQQSIQASIAEILAAKEALKEISSAKEGEKIFVMLGAGMLAEATIAKNTAVKQEIGSGVVVEKSIGNALESLEKMRAEHEKKIELLQNEQNKTLASLQFIGSIIFEAERQGKPRQ